MTWLGKLMIIILLLLLGTCFIVRRFPDEKTSKIEKVKKEYKVKVKKEEPKLPISKPKNLKLKPWKKEKQEQLFYTLEDEEIHLLC